MQANVPAHRRKVAAHRIPHRMVTASVAVSLAAAGLTVSQAVGASAVSLLPAKVATTVITHQSVPSTLLASRTLKTTGKQLLVAFLASDSASNAVGARFDAVTGCGLTWSRVVEANQQAGPVAIWSAIAPTSLPGCSVSARRNFGSWMGSIYVVGYTGAAGIGARAAASASGGAASVSVQTTREQSLVTGVAVDWDRAVSRVPVAGQQVVAQTLASVGDTYWLQTMKGAVAKPGSVRLMDTSTTRDRFNFAAVEILAQTSTTGTVGHTPSTTVVPAPVPTTTTVVPAPVPTTTTVVPAPSSGFPDASNTGVPAGTTLTPVGDLTISTPGAIVEGKDVRGTVQINASNVTFRRSRVSGSGFSIIRVKDGVTGVRIEDVTVNGLGKSGTSNSMGVMGPASVFRSDISGVENGITPDSGSVLQDNWIHGLDAPGSPHLDGIQMDGGLSDISILHNTIDLREWSQTAAVMIDNYFGPISNIKVDGNRLLGAGYTVYSDGQFSGGSITGVSFTNNHLVRGYWGYALIRNNATAPVWSGNVLDGTTTTVAP